MVLSTECISSYTNTDNSDIPTVLFVGKPLTCITNDHLFFISELFEINHIRTIYHMFIAVLLIFSLSTLAVDYIDQGRSV